MKIIILFVTFLFSTIIGWAQTSFTVDGIRYTTTGANTVEVSSGGNYTGSIVIPSSVEYSDETLTVLSIGNSAFKRCTSLTSVVIPTTVTNIGGSAFYGCKSLSSINISSNVTSIGSSAFTDCSALIIVDSNNDNYSSLDGVLYNKVHTSLIQCPITVSGSFTISTTVVSIQDYAFYGCTSLISADIPSSVKTIGSSAFSGCTSLTLVTIPSSLETLEGYTFSGCKSLISINIPSSVNSIRSHAFYRCSALINVESSNENYSSKDGVLYDKDQTTLIHCPLALSGTVNIPSSVTSIESYAFWGCYSLTKVTIPPSVSSIGYQSFMNCTSLSEVIIPTSVIVIGGFAFNGCRNIESVVIPNSVTTIGESAFAGCLSLTSVSIPSSVTIIGIKVFEGCSSLNSINIPTTLLSIGSSAFSGCISLKSVTIPTSVTSIESQAFSSCTSLTTIFSYLVNPMNLNSGQFDGVDKTTCTLHIPIGTKESYQVTTGWSEFVNIKESLVPVGYDFNVEGIIYTVNELTKVSIKSKPSFTGTDLPTKVTYLGLDYEITSIENSVFEYYPDFIDITVPNTVTTIGNFTFNSCTNLKSIVLPGGLQSIGNYCFYNCASLSSIKVNSATPPALGTDVFSLVDKSKCILYVPIGSLNSYKAAEQWIDFVNIIEYNPTGIENDIIPTLNVYPNPAKDFVQISGIQNGLIRIFNLNGKVIVEQNFNADNKIDLQGFLSGVYLYRIQSADGNHNGKIVKQ